METFQTWYGLLRHHWSFVLIVILWEIVLFLLPCISSFIFFKNFWGATTLLIWAISPALSEFWIHSILWWQIYPIQVNVVNLQALEN